MAINIKLKILAVDHKQLLYHNPLLQAEPPTSETASLRVFAKPKAVPRRFKIYSRADAEIGLVNHYILLPLHLRE